MKRDEICMPLHHFFHIKKMSRKEEQRSIFSSRRQSYFLSVSSVKSVLTKPAQNSERRETRNGETKAMHRM